MAFSAAVASDFLTLDADFEAFIASSDAVVIQLVFGESVTFRFNVDAAGTTDDVELEVMQGHRVFASALALDGAASATSLNLNTVSDAIAVDDDLNGTYLVMMTGGERGEMRLITDSAATGDVATLDHALSGTPSATETYLRYRMNIIRNTIDMSAAISESAPHNKGISRNWTGGEFVAVRARATGATDTHRIQMSYSVDGGPV